MKDVTPIVKEITEDLALNAEETIESIRDARLRLEQLEADTQMAPAEMQRSEPDLRIDDEDMNFIAAIGQEMREMSKRMDGIEARLRVIFNQEKTENSEKE